MRRHQAVASLVALAALSVLFATGAARATATASTVEPGHVLIYGPSLNTAFPFNEESIARSLGYEVAVADTIAWRALRTSDFARYDAIIVGDRGCSEGDSGYLATAESTRTTWSPAVTGNVAVLATDPVFHLNVDGTAAARKLIENGLRQATAGETTGAYLALGCAFAFAPAFTPVTLLQGFGPFTVRGQTQPPFTGCPNTVRVVQPRSPLVAGLSQDDLSGWGCSMHAGVDSYAFPFSVVARDRVTGLPYLLTRRPTTSAPSSRRTTFAGPTSAVSPWVRPSGANLG